MKFRDEKGSIVVEAALVLPMFLLFIIFLVSLIRIVIVEISLNEVASNMTKQVATHLYPADYLVNRTQTGQAVVGSVDDVKAKAGEIMTIIEKGEAIIGDTSPLSDTINNNIKEMEEYVQMMSDDAGAAFFTPIVQAMVKDHRYIDEQNLKVVDVDVPNLRDKGNDGYVGLVIQYKLNIPMPFKSKEIILTKKAYERAWIGS
jgi:Flp pilus assembly protein TadG